MHENVVYLPGVRLPTSIVATPDIRDCVAGATMLVFVIPHNFLAPIVPKMQGAFAKVSDRDARCASSLCG